MRTSFTRLWMLVAVCAALAGCEADDGDDPTPDADAPDAVIGAGGEGGEGGNAGMGGEGGEGGMGGEIPDGPCRELGERACDAREDCAARRDVFGAFVDCQRIEDVPCSMLDPDDCGSREDCELTGELCSPVAIPCSEQPEVRSCVGAGCHWWGDECHDQPEPARCDQPDPASCENAGCTWGDDGCMPTPPACADLDRPATCDARPDCRWNNNRCEIDPGEMACGDLDMRTCAERADCAWHDGACQVRPEGACGELDAAQCALRPDCESNDCNCPPDAQCDCENLCRPRVFDCSDVPLDACARTPGCMLEDRPSDDCAPAMNALIACFEQVCVPDEAARCAQLDPASCNADPACQLVWQDNCGGMDGGGADGRADADRAAPPFPEDPPCQQQICVPRDDGAICAEIQDARECAGTPGCQLTDVCACDGGPDPACQCEPGAPCPCLVIAPPCECAICMDAPGGFCEGQSFDACVNNPNCQWVWAGQDGGMEPVPGVCECRIDADGREICECFGGAPLPPEEGWCIDNQMWMGCEGIANQRECLANPECEWNAFDCGGCFIDEAGNEVCRECPDGGGFCSTVMRDPCNGFDEAICADIEGCEWVLDAGVPDRDDPALPPDADQPADPAVPARPAPCPCFPGPDGEIICECDPVPPPPAGICQTAPPPGEHCWALPPDACEADPECAMLDGGFGMDPVPACPPCEPGRACEPCAALIAPAGCVPVEFWCNVQPADACDPRRCMIEEIEVCNGGGGMVPPDCAPGEACALPFVPPPPDGECWVERVCTGAR